MTEQIPVLSIPGPDAELRALTLIQPWATLIVQGHKTIETRTWRTPYRGWLAIHAGKSTDLVDDPAKHTFGAVVAITRIVDCRPMTVEDEPAALVRSESGRYAWELADIHALDTPIPMRGYQGLWRPKPNALAALRSQIETMDTDAQAPEHKKGQAA